MDEMLDRFERIFGVPMRRVVVEARGWLPPMDMIDQKDEVLIKAELPGVIKEDIRVSVSGNTLSIEGERKRPRIGVCLDAKGVYKRKTEMLKRYR